MKSCEKCGIPFTCGMQQKRSTQTSQSDLLADDGSTACWCQSLPLATGVPDQFKDCLCPTCLALFASSPIEEKQDFYLNEQGLMVFTRDYHLKRGYCCDSGCKHCPY